MEKHWKSIKTITMSRWMLNDAKWHQMASMTWQNIEHLNILEHWFVDSLVFVSFKEGEVFFLQSYICCIWKLRKYIYLAIKCWIFGPQMFTYLYIVAFCKVLKVSHFAVEHIFLHIFWRFWRWRFFCYAKYLEVSQCKLHTSGLGDGIPLPVAQLSRWCGGCGVKSMCRLLSLSHVIECT